MKKIIYEYGWIGLILLFMVLMAIMYKIVDTPELVGAKTFEVTEMTPEDIAEEMYFDDLENLALCTMAECGAESDSCIRATCDVMINRVADPKFPDTFYDVFAQPGQYETFKKYYSINPTDRVFTICREQLEYFWAHGETQHPGALYFRMKHYHGLGRPLYCVGAHYFSGR